VEVSHDVVFFCIEVSEVVEEGGEGEHLKNTCSILRSPFLPTGEMHLSVSRLWRDINKNTTIRLFYRWVQFLNDFELNIHIHEDEAL
jgi:hypothetical protein